MKTKINFKQIFKVVKKATSDHLPEILMGFGIASMVVSTVEAVGSTKDAIEAIDERKEELGLDEDEKLPVKETIKVAGKFYIPSGVAAVVGIGCLIGSNSLHAKRYSTLMAAYALSDSTVQSYRKKLVDALGEEKAEKVDKEVREEAVRENFKPDIYESLPSGILEPGGGTVLCKDAFSGRPFWGNKAMWTNAVASLNNILSSDVGEPYASMNEFYDFVGEHGLEHIESGESVGWNASWGKLIEPSFDWHGTSSGIPYMVCGFSSWSRPKHGYQGLR